MPFAVCYVGRKRADDEGRGEAISVHPVGCESPEQTYQLRRPFGPG